MARKIRTNKNNDETENVYLMFVLEYQKVFQRAADAYWEQYHNSKSSMEESNITKTNGIYIQKCSPSQMFDA